MIGEAELRWLLAGIGAAIIALIFLWERRTHIRERLRERRRRTAPLTPENEPVLLEAAQPRLEADSAEAHGFGDFSDVPPDHPLADKMLVDVEITPVHRSATEQPAEGDETIHGDEAPRQPAPPQPPAAEEPAETPAPLPEAPRQAATPEPPPAEVRPEARRSAPLPAVEPVRDKPATPPAPSEPKMTVLLTVTAPTGKLYKGPSILLAAQDLKLKLHKNGVFDYFPEGQGRGKPLFGIGHLREPGIFSLESMGHLATPGLLLFMQLPGPLPAAEAVETLTSVAKQLAQKLGGSIGDERRNRLTPQALLKLKNDAVRFERRLQTQAHR